VTLIYFHAFFTFFPAVSSPRAVDTGLSMARTWASGAQRRLTDRRIFPISPFRSALSPPLNPLSLPLNSATVFCAVPFRDVSRTGRNSVELLPFLHYRRLDPQSSQSPFPPPPPFVFPYSFISKLWGPLFLIGIFTQSFPRRVRSQRRKGSKRRMKHFLLQIFSSHFPRSLSLPFFPPPLGLFDLCVLCHVSSQCIFIL